MFQHAKNQLIPSLNYLDTFKFSPESRLVTPIFDHAQPNNFQSTINFCEFVSSCKKCGVSSVCSRESVYLKILQSDRMKTFWSIFPEQDFSQTQDLCRNTVTWIFIMEKSQWKLMTKFFFKFKNILAHFCNFWVKKIFSKKTLTLSRIIS